MIARGNQDGANNEVSAQAPTLAQRLSSPGVIDVNGAKNRYERTTGWLTRRTLTIDRLLSRFRAGDAGIKSNRFVFSKTERHDPDENHSLISSGSYAPSPTQTGLARTGPALIAKKAEPADTAFLKREESIKTAAPGTGSASTVENTQKNGVGDGISEPIQRLVQRKESPGAVNVSMIQRQYDRTSAPIAHESGLISRLESRMFHEKKEPAPNADRTAPGYVQREAAMQGPDLKTSEEADAAAEPPGNTLPGIKAISWRYQSRKDTEAGGQIEVKLLPGQPSPAYLIQKKPGNAEATLRGSERKEQKPNSPLAALSGSEADVQTPLRGTFRVSRKKTLPPSGVASSSGSRLSTQDPGIVPAVGIPETFGTMIFKKASEHAVQNPARTVSLRSGDEHRTQDISPLSQDEKIKPASNPNRAGTSAIVRKPDKLEPAVRDEAPVTGPVRRAAEMIQPQGVAQRKMALSSAAPASFNTGSEARLAKEPAPGNRALHTLTENARGRDRSDSNNKDKDGEQAKPLLREKENRAVNVQTQTNIARDTMILREQAPERSAKITTEQARVESGTANSNGAQLSANTAGQLKRVDELIQPKLSEEKQAQTAKENLLTIHPVSRNRPSGPASIDNPTADTSARSTGMILRKSKENEIRHEEQLKTAQTLPGREGNASTAVNFASASAAHETGQGSNTRQDPAAGNPRMIFLKPAAAPEVMTTRIEHYDSKQIPNAHEKRGQIESYSLSGDRTAPPTAAPGMASATSERTLYSAAVRVMRTHAGGKPEGHAGPDHKPGIAAELPAQTAVPKTAIIWRKNEREMTGATTFGSGRLNGFTRAGGPGLVSRLAAPAAEASSIAPQQGNQNAAAETRVPAFDLDVLAEQVGRRLFRQIEIERERRGVGL